MKDHWLKCISTKGNIRAVAVKTTHTCNELIKTHGLSGPSAQGLGEAVTGALLLASYCKSGERINLNIRSSGILRGALVDAYPEATVRGYVTLSNEQSSQLPLWGSGTISVLKTKTSEGEKPYIGTVPLLTGHLAKDLSFYWLQSEQVPSAVGIAVNCQKDTVFSSAGFLVQSLPGATDEELDVIVGHINEIQSLAEKISENENPISLLTQIFQSTPFVITEERNITHSCGCSIERAERAVTLLGPAEIKAMAAETDEVLIFCDFCKKEYRLTKEQLSKCYRA